MLLVSRDTIAALSLLCAAAECFAELGEGWYRSRVMAWHGRKAAELARCASRRTQPRSTLIPSVLPSTAFAGSLPIQL